MDYANGKIKPSGKYRLISMISADKNVTEKNAITGAVLKYVKTFCIQLFFFSLIYNDFALNFIKVFHV